MVLETGAKSGEPAGSRGMPSGYRLHNVAPELDEVKAQKILNTIRVSKNFIDGVELAKQCRAVIEFYFEREDYARVIEASSVVDTRDLAPEGTYMLVTSYIMNGDYEKARTMIQSLHWGDRPDCKLTALGKLLVSQGKELDAKVHFEEALKLNPSNSDAMNELSSRWPHDDSALRVEGEALRLDGDPKGATIAFRELIQHGESSPEVLRSAGIALADARDYAEAEEMLKKSAESASNAETSLALGLVQLERGESEAGIANIESAMSGTAPVNAEILKRLTLAYIATGNQEAAIQVLDRLVADESVEKEELKRFQTAVIDSCRTKGAYQVMLHTAEKLLNAESQNVKASGAKLDALAGLGRYQDGLIFLDGLKNFPDFKQRRMVLLRKAERFQEADHIADEILTSDRGNQDALFTKLYLPYATGKGKECVSKLSKAVLRYGGEEVLRLYLELAKKERDDIAVVKATQSLVSLGVDDAQVLGDRAAAVERLGRVSQSGYYLRKLAARFGDEQSLELLSSFYARHGNKAEEERTLSEALSSMDLPIGLLERLAKLKMDRGDIGGALAVIVKAMEKTETSEGRYLQAEVLLKAGNAEESKIAAAKAMQLGYPGKLGEFLFGKAERMLGARDAALEHFDRSISYGLNSPEVFLEKISLLREMERLEEAKEETRNLESLFPDSAEVQTACIEFYYSAGMHQQCIEAAEKAIRTSRENERAWSRRGLSLLALKRYDEAIVSLEAGLKLRKDGETVQGLKEAYNAKGDRKSIIRSIDLLLEFKGNDKNLLLEKGDVLAESGKHAEALSTYQSAIDRFGKDAEAVMRKASILHEQKKYADELEVLLEIWKGNDELPSVASMMSRAYLEMKRYTDALEYADRAMQLEPENVRHLDLRSEILFSLGRFDEAESSADIALSMSPKDPTALEIKGNILMADGRFDQALGLLNGALAAGICTSKIYKNRGDCLLNLERFQEALDSYSKALKDSPQNMGALLGKGVCELHTEKYSSATLSLNEVTKKDPENGRGWYYFGVALKNQRIFSEARRAFSKAVELDGTLDMAWLELGEMQLSAREFEAAEKAFERAFELAPHNSEHREALENCRIELKKLRAEQNAISLLKLEYDINRNPTKEEAFSVCRIPMDEIDMAFDLVNEPTTLPIPSSGDREWREVEDRSASVLAKCFRNRETASYGVRLCDIVANFQSYSLDEAKQIFEYIAKVQKLSVIDALEDERFEKLMKRATKLRKEDRSLIGIIENLGVGIYTAKLIEGSLASMGISGYTTDFVTFSDGHEESAAPAQAEDYDPYSERRMLYEQFYGGRKQEEQEIVETDDRCLYHGGDAIGSCSSCQTNICDSCLTATNGHCPNCGVVLVSGESEGGAAY